MSNPDYLKNPKITLTKKKQPKKKSGR